MQATALPSLLAIVAQGDTTGSADGSFVNMLIPMAAVAAIFFFLVIGPERKKQKARDAMLAGMKKGDEVMTTSGMYGRIARIQDDTVTLQVADGVRLRFNRAAVQSVVEQGERKGEDAGSSEAAPESAKA